MPPTAIFFNKLSDSFLYGFTETFCKKRTAISDGNNAGHESHKRIHAPHVCGKLWTVYCWRVSRNSISTMRSELFLPFLSLMMSSSPACAAATSTICPNASASWVAPFRRRVILSDRTGLSMVRCTYPRLLGVFPLHTRLSPAYTSMG